MNCETDFVAKTDDFKALVDTVAKLVAEQDPQDVDALWRWIPATAPWRR